MTLRIIHAAQQLAKTIPAHARSLLFAKPFKSFKKPSAQIYSCFRLVVRHKQANKTRSSS